MPAAERLLESPFPLIAAATDASGQASILAAYGEAKPALEARMAEAIGALQIPSGYLATANRFMAESIEAGLALGDMTLVDPEIECLACLLHHRHVPENWLSGYLVAYSQAAAEAMRSHDPPVLSWLERRAVSGAPTGGVQRAV